MDSTTLKLITLALLASSTVGADGEQVYDMVGPVRQNFAANINGLIVDQITLELKASYVYQAYASYFQRADVSLPGIGQFFNHHSLEKRGQANGLIEYLNARGGHAQFSQLDLLETCRTSWSETKGDDSGLYDRAQGMCICNFVATGKANRNCPTESEDREEWREALMAFVDALTVERFLNAQLHKLHQAADLADDADFGHRLEHSVLGEQIKVIYELGQHITRLRLFASRSARNYKLGEYILDQHFQASLSHTGAEAKAKI